MYEFSLLFLHLVHPFIKIKLTTLCESFRWRGCPETILNKWESEATLKRKTNPASNQKIFHFLQKTTKFFCFPRQVRDKRENSKDNFELEIIESVELTETLHKKVKDKIISKFQIIWKSGMGHLDRYIGQTIMQASSCEGRKSSLNQSTIEEGIKNILDIENPKM